MERKRRAASLAGGSAPDQSDMVDANTSLQGSLLS